MCLSRDLLSFLSLEPFLVLLLSPQSLSFGNVCCPHLDELGNGFLFRDIVRVHDGLPEWGKDITFIVWHGFKGWVMEDMRHEFVLVCKKCLETGFCNYGFRIVYCEKLVSVVLCVL
jgi:hypothetical protein